VSTVWVLIVILVSAEKTASFSQEFFSKETCEKAAEVVKQGGPAEKASSTLITCQKK
jgi:uncharacterized protein YegP (UPF0339 family)